MEEEKKSEKKFKYYPEVQRKYGEKCKTMSCKVRKEEYHNIEKYFLEKGYTSASGYIRDLIKKDMNK